MIPGTIAEHRSRVEWARLAAECAREARGSYRGLTAAQLMDAAAFWTFTRTRRLFERRLARASMLRRGAP